MDEPQTPPLHIDEKFEERLRYLRRIAALEAELARVTTERDEWASKWKEMRRMLAEVKYPGMTNIVKVMDGDAALAKGEK